MISMWCVRFPLAIACAHACDTCKRQRRPCIPGYTSEICRNSRPRRSFRAVLHAGKQQLYGSTAIQLSSWKSIVSGKSVGIAIPRRCWIPLCERASHTNVEVGERRAFHSGIAATYYHQRQRPTLDSGVLTRSAATTLIRTYGCTRLIGRA